MVTPETVAPMTENDSSGVALSAPQVSRPDSRSPAATLFDQHEFDRAIFSSLASLRMSSRQLFPNAACDGCGSRERCTCSHEYYADFSPTPMAESSMYHDAGREAWVYDAKRDVPTQHPWVEWGRILYGDGITPRGRNWFGERIWSVLNFTSTVTFAPASRRSQRRRANRQAGSRLNLDMDLQITDTERFHAFVGPLDKAESIHAVGSDRWRFALPQRNQPDAGDRVLRGRSRRHARRCTAASIFAVRSCRSRSD